MVNGITRSMCHLNGQDGTIEIFHNIYGKQNIGTKIRLIDDVDKVGVYICNQEIYLTMDEIKDVQISKGSAFISGDLMQIKITCK